jgi:hypothetical protein
MLRSEEEQIRLILRHLRRAQHELSLTKDIGGFLVRPSIDGCLDTLYITIGNVEAELARLRGQR